MAEESPIILRIGAGLESSVERSFQLLEERAKKAAAEVGKGTDSSAKSAEKAAQRRVTADERAAKKAETAATKAAAKQQRELDKTAEVAKKAADKAADAQVKATEKVIKAKEKAAARERAIEERATTRRVSDFARRSSRFVANSFIPYVPVGSIAKRAGAEVMRGMGVDLSVASSFQRNISLESQAIGLAQQERIATGGTTAGAAHYEAIARRGGKALGVDNTDPIELMRAFSGKTGDFAKLEEVVSRLGPLAVASGTGFQNMGDAAGFFYNQVKHLPNAMDLTVEGMRAIIGQTAVGAVEMPDFAKHMGRIAANASKFSGDRGTNIAQFSALAQLSMETGGAASAAEAARGVGAFSNTLGKNARIKAFKSAGVELFSDPGTGPGKNTTYRPMFDIIKDSITKTGGNIPMLGGMWADSIGRKPVTALATAYRDAGGGEAGLLAMNAALDKYMNATLSATAEQENVNDHLKSAAAQAKIFQNELDEVSKEAQAELLPALKELKQPILDLARFMANVTHSALENPKTAAAVAVGGVVGMSALNAGVRLGGEMLVGAAAGKVMKMFGSRAAGAAAGAGEGVLAGAGSGFFSTAVGGAKIGLMGAGLAGIAAGAGIMAAHTANEDLKKTTGGMGALDLISGMISSGEWNPAKVVDKFQNQQAKLEAAGAGGNQVSMQDIVDSASKDSAELEKRVVEVKNALSGTLKVEVTNRNGDRDSQL